MQGKLLGRNDSPASRRNKQRECLVELVSQGGHKFSTGNKKKRIYVKDYQLREIGTKMRTSVIMNMHRSSFHLFGLPIEKHGLMQGLINCMRQSRSHAEPIDYTRLDLAIQAENREFLGHDFVQRFLDKVWGSSSEARGLFSMKPKHKFYLHFLSFALFLVT
jgi:hypothetical protein